MVEPTLAEIRARYAAEVMRRAHVENPALAAAFGRVERERFLGAGPWRIAGPGGYRTSVSSDPGAVYVDALIALDSARGVNNGEPSAHAHWIDALGLQPGERVDHIGAGTGYYSAILAELVGERGRVEAWEIEASLAARARAALADRPNVFVHAASGVDRPLPEADAIYVNAGATEPKASWLDALAPGGRLVFPLTDARGLGGMLRITRGADGRWPARFLSGAAFIDMVGGRDARAAEALGSAFRNGRCGDVRWLLRDRKRGRTDWLRGDGWRLTREPA